MILSCVIYLTSNLHDKNIPDMISDEGQGQISAKFKHFEQKCQY